MRPVLIIVIFLNTISLYGNQLIVFTNSEKEVDKSFIENYLDQIKSISIDYSLELIEIDIKNGAPADITITPQIVFQNHKGRSYYTGRYSELSRLKIFIRTTAQNPQVFQPNLKKNILTYQNGRSSVILPLKITKVSGPFDLDKTDFDTTVKEMIQSSFTQFNVKQEFKFKRTNRAFYVDVHPYVDDDAKLFLSYEVYSQFNCANPVISMLQKPLIYDLSKKKEAFNKLANIIEKEIFNLISNDEKGDGFSIIENSVPVQDWNTTLPETSFSEYKSSYKNVFEGIMPSKWSVEGPVDKVIPLIQFNFFTPLDSYAGEVITLRGTLIWEDDEISGGFMVNTNDVDMGEESYNKNVHRKYIKVRKFPSAEFLFQEFKLSKESWKNNQDSTLAISGLFSFMGKEMPVTAYTNISPYLCSDGSLKLIIQSFFNINIYEKFGVKGPDGPKEAKENMHFQLYFVMADSTSQLITN